MPPKRAVKSGVRAKSKNGSRKSKAATKKTAPQLSPGSQEEVSSLLKELLSVQQLANPPPGSDPPSAAISALFEQTTQKLRRSIHDYTEYEAMYQQTARSRNTTPNVTTDENEYRMRQLVWALERTLLGLEGSSPSQANAPHELLRQDEFEVMDEILSELEASVLKPFKGFLTKRPQWLPEDRMIIDGCDKEFTVRDFDALHIDDSNMAPMPDIPDLAFHTGAKGNFNKLQNKAANTRFKDYDLRNQLQLERDQIKLDLDNKDRQIEELNSQKTKEESLEGGVYKNKDSEGVVMEDSEMTGKNCDSLDLNTGFSTENDTESSQVASIWDWSF